MLSSKTSKFTVEIENKQSVWQGALSGFGFQRLSA